MSKKLPKSDYEVGYRKPPKKHQFQPGQSGNQGRKRKARPPKALLDVIDDVLWKSRKMMIDGKEQWCSYGEIMVEQVAQAAAKGDNKAFGQIAKLLLEGDARKISAPPREDESEPGMKFTLKIGDPEVVRRAIEAQRGKMDPD